MKIIMRIFILATMQLIGVVFLVTLVGGLFGMLTVQPWCVKTAKRLGISPSFGASLLAGIGEYQNRWGVKCEDAWLRDFVHWVEDGHPNGTSREFTDTVYDR